ncbi:aspartyl/asparaginyl beta-hydroxylase-like isoform X4 [Erinaceus europaeus]|uniref:Aspartyl/asparaginyl beta-hydroxylase-like isoform X4 n=1 Tax=Erinaceus europaeus TaxID=9365 RepID=A0ABM3WU65_ERIEU|nr:aspartyl/asparaginyl beta-hydroxylase-like isoform X4 [Erinaceus europaeus]
MAEETKHGGHKNGRKGGLSGSSFFTWFMVIALLGVWTSVAVVWFDLVDYEEVLGLKERPTSEPAAPPGETDPDPWLEEQVPKRPEPEHTDDDLQEQILSLLHETVHAEHGKQLQQEEDGPTEELQLEDSFMEGSDTDDRFETLETGTFHEEAEDSYHVEDTAPQDYTQGMEDIVYPQENLDSIEPAVEDGGRMSNDADDITYQDYDDQVYELPEHERRQASDNAIDDSHILLEDLPVSPAEEPGMAFYYCMLFFTFLV